MSYYLFEGSYTSESAAKMLAAPSDRGAAAKTLVESMDGTYHHFFFSLGDSDWIFLCELPDDTSAAAVSLKIGASGAMSKTKTTKLLTPQDAQAAMAKAGSATYLSPLRG